MSADPKVKSRSALRTRATGRRKWLFRLIALSLALSPFLIGEAICRIAGYGGYPPVFKTLRTYQGGQFVGTYQPGINTFFWQNLSSTGSMEEQVFLSPKPKGVTRIMAFGGSAMRGFPQPPTLVSTSFLRAMLADLWPGRDVEVLNFGTTAIASFPVMHILEEAVEYEPDLVIIYSGNNEFYGADGVASLHSFGQSTLAMSTLRSLRATGLGQWITDVITSRQATAATPNADGRQRSLMESVIADGQIGPDDRRRDNAKRNLENHLTAMVSVCHDRGIPVILCTLPVNERDMRPLGVDASPGRTGDEQKRISQMLGAAEAGLRDRPAESAKSARDALALNGGSATAHFLLGRSLMAQGLDADARQEFRASIELDPMPWRAPPSLSDVVRRIASDHGAILCDLEKSFEAASPHGAIGWELMDDHVHPSLRGQSLVAETMLRAMTRLKPPLLVTDEAIAKLPEWDVYAAKLGDNEFDQFGVEHRLRTLFRAPFYAGSNPEALARAEARCAELLKGFTPSEIGAIEYWQKPETHSGGFRPITGFVGAVLLSEGHYEKADRLLSIARRCVPRYSLWNLELTWKMLTARRKLRSTPSNEDTGVIQEMIADGETMYRATGIRNAELCRHLGLAYYLLGNHRQAVTDLNTALQSVTDMSGFEVVQALVDSLIRTNQKERAIRVLRSPIQDPALAAACRSLLSQIENPAQ